MARGKVDGAGLAKLAALEEAQVVLQRIHGLVEQMALAARASQNTAPFIQSIRRATAPLVSMLKTQFGAASDVAAQMVLVASRSGMNEKARLRTLREGVGSMRAQLEAAEIRVRQQHAVEDDKLEKRKVDE